MSGNKISYGMDGETLKIYVGDSLLAEVENGEFSEEFVADVLDGLGYKWLPDGTIERE